MSKQPDMAYLHIFSETGPRIKDLFSIDGAHPEMADGSANGVEVKARGKFDHAIGVIFG
jgi:hypothetical protein